jgi:hypothetical protein
MRRGRCPNSRAWPPAPTAIKELLARAFGAAEGGLSPIEQVIRWARTAEEATPDPSKKA